MTTLEKKYVEYFTPLIQDFIREMEPLELPAIDRMPEPFFPMFGTRYEQSALRLVIIGQDTRSWGDLRNFIPAEMAEPGSRLLASLGEFQDHDFTGWGSTRQTFWGFAMMMLAAIHGQDNWGAMKRGAMSEVLDSFAWGNCNAVELYGSSASGLGVPLEFWEKVRRAGEPLNRFRHIVETLKPQTAIVLYQGMNPATYFEGYHYDEVSAIDGVTHYRLPEIGVDVFHVPHPRNMNFNEGPDYFCARLKEILLAQKLTVQFPAFLNGQQETEDVMSHLQRNAPPRGPEFDKYEFIAWVADELKKRDTFMSVPSLIGLVNTHGYTTNRGTSFADYGKGPYKLVSATYHRMMGAERPERAHNVAVAFRQPDNEYAYDIDD